ncbi:hypothetical protein [Clostridium sp.]|uniref:hypothetical protein n=1 Tax=Clostridium sp. TaxID=1506 RepID=UPI002FCA1818
MRAAGVSFIGTAKELKERIDNLRIINLLTDEVVILYFEVESLEKALEIVKEYKKECLGTVQSNQSTQEKQM